MNIVDLNTKIFSTTSDLRLEIENYIKENSKFKVGDVVDSTLSNNGQYFVISKLGFNNEIIYYGNKVIKSSGEVSSMSMDSDIGTPEKCLNKTTLKIKGKELSFIEESKYFTDKIRINIHI